MFGIGMPELVIILVIALLVIGPQKLPELAKSLGKGLAEFKKATDDFQRNMNEAARKEDEKPVETQQVADAAKEEVEGQYKSATAEPAVKKEEEKS